jgi:hypothetical protein
VRRIEHLILNTWEALELKDKSTYELLIEAELSEDARKWNTRMMGRRVYTAFMPYHAVIDTLDSAGVTYNHARTNETASYLPDTYCASDSEDTASFF